MSHDRRTIVLSICLSANPLHSKTLVLFSSGGPALLLRGAERSDVSWRKETRRSGLEGSAAVAEGRDAHGYTQQGSGELCIRWQQQQRFRLVEYLYVVFFSSSTLCCSSTRKPTACIFLVFFFSLSDDEEGFRQELSWYHNDARSPTPHVARLQARVVSLATWFVRA